MTKTSVGEEKTAPDSFVSAASGDPFKGAPNFMASLAQGLEVIQAFTPQRRLMSISQISQKTGIPRALPVYPEKLGFVYAQGGKTLNCARGS